MDILKDKQYKDYSSISRYNNFPFYYHAKDKKYIYDPVNMMRFANGSMLPRISQVVDSEDKFYVETKNIFNI